MISQFCTVKLPEKTPTSIIIAIKTIRIRLKAKRWSKKVFSMPIINGVYPPIERPTVSKTLNRPMMSRLFHSALSMKVMGLASSTPGMTKNERVIPKKTWKSIGQAIDRGTFVSAQNASTDDYERFSCPICLM